MGLDMYAYTLDENKERVEIAYWRKHNRLHGWMENLYREKGGLEQFNCESVELTEEDVNRLESAINNNGLPETHGFFFGNDSYEEYEEWYKEDDLKFVEAARQVLADGGRVFYDSWW